jgi:hypothetical protein
VEYTILTTFEVLHMLFRSWHEFEVREILSHCCWVESRELRRLMNLDRSWLTAWSLPAFHSLMADMVDKKIVEVRLEEGEIAGHKATIRKFRLIPLSQRRAG